MKLKKFLKKIDKKLDKIYDLTNQYLLDLCDLIDGDIEGTLDSYWKGKKYYINIDLEIPIFKKPKIKK